MMERLFRTGSLAAIASSVLAATMSVGLANGIPQPGQMSFEQAASPISDYQHWFHNALLMPIIVAIVLFVAVLLAFVCVRFNEKNNPVPSLTTHHTLLEIAWTIVPVLILFVIAIPSMKLLADELIVPKTDMTIKVTGKQWFWSYEYPKDQGGGFSFDSNLIHDADLKPGDIRQLSVDNEVVVPVDTPIHLLVTGADVIHGFVIQSFGVRVDAVPGRMNEEWFKATKPGIFYGQCSKLCGKDHAFMPIAFRVVSKPEYEAWLKDAKKKFASAGPERHYASTTPGPVRVAGNQ